MYVQMVITYSKSIYGSTGLGCQSCSWSAGQGNRSRETGSAVPSRVSLLILYTQAESGPYSRDSSRFPRRRPLIYLNRHTPSSQSRVHQVTQLLRTDGVHCRESAGTDKASSPQCSSSDRCCHFADHHRPINVRISLPTPTILLLV